MSQVSFATGRDDLERKRLLVHRADYPCRNDPIDSLLVVGKYWRGEDFKCLQRLSSGEASSGIVGAGSSCRGH